MILNAEVRELPKRTPNIHVACKTERNVNLNLIHAFSSLNFALMLGKSSFRASQTSVNSAVKSKHIHPNNLRGRTL